MSIRVTETGISFEELIGGHEITALEKNISITSGTALARGSVLTATGALAGKGDTASYVLALDVSETDTVATVYTSGMFNREKLIVAAEDTVDSHEAELRDVNIYLTSLH